MVWVVATRICFHPYIVGEDEPILTFAYFSDGLVQPPTSGGQGLPGNQVTPALGPDRTWRVPKFSGQRLGLIKHGAQWSEVLNVGGTQLPPGYVGWCYIIYTSHVQKEIRCNQRFFLKMPSLQDVYLVVWRFHHDILTEAGKLSFQNDLKPPRLEIATDGFPNIKIHSGTRFKSRDHLKPTGNCWL